MSWVRCVLGVLVLMSLNACGHTPPRDEPKAGPAQSKDGFLAMWSTSIKDRGSNYDVNFNIKNLTSNQHLLVQVSELSCSRGDTPGAIRNTPASEKAVDFKPGQVRTLKLTCSLPSRASGDYVIQIGKVFSKSPNPHHGMGSVVVEGLTWHYVESGPVMPQ